MKGALRRRVLVGTTLALVACGPLIGIDDLHDRSETSALDGSVDAASDSNLGVDANTNAEAGPECTAHSQCNTSASTNLALCVEGRCTKVNREHCLNDVLPLTGKAPLLRDNALVVAAFTPIHNTKPTSQPPVLAYNLALEELDKAGGLTLNDKRYDLVMLLCASEDQYSEAALEHVVNDLKIPAIIGNFSNEAFPKYVADITLPADVFVLNPNVTPEPVKYLATKQTVLNLLGPVEDLALSYRPLLAEMTVAANRRKGAADNAPVKVSLITTETLREQEMSVVIRQGAFDPNGGARDTTKAIQINGAPPDLDAGSFTFDSIVPLDVQDPSNFTAVIDKLTAFRPDIVIALTGQEIETLVPDYETALINDTLDAGAQADADASIEGQKVLPLWLLGPKNGNRPLLLAYLKGDKYEKRTLRVGRFTGIQYAGSSIPALKTEWLTRMNDRYLASGVAPADYSQSENFYDAVYWLAYGYFRGKVYDVNATDRVAFRTGVRRLIDGPVDVNAGTAQAIGLALARLRNDDGRYVGALGPPDIDKQYGTWRADGTVFCYPDPGSGLDKVVKQQPDSRRYLSDGGVVVNLDCPLPQ